MRQPELPQLSLPSRIHRLRRINVAATAQFFEHASRRANSLGVEFRNPMLDHRFVELALRLPGRVNWRSGWDKFGVRLAGQGFLPDQVLQRRQKVLLTPLLRRGAREKRSYLKELATDMRAAELGYVDERELRATIDDFVHGRSDDCIFWFALTLEDWLRRHF